ncbi:hypothetical protein ACFX2I_041016 [Malus domestica]|uniref:Uncharacterized protein n=1 Tax=Malus domestica TaxID=3750 RepID=A0A498JEQ1_MALDO|nr:uncharacterized protein LOC103439470 [Malus domestica]XP_050155955.1 uncharacterized protein LOC126629855 [Malus sylvestris]RXH94178.1 hypothetical protein DVH24_023862 [Malus domestica]
MNWNLLRPEYATWQPEWTEEEIRSTFFKCTKWQVEETLDPINCPYHYYCTSSYAGNYSQAVDFLLLFFAAASYLATLVFMVMHVSGKGQKSIQSKRYLLPSGPVALPLIILALAYGHRINSAFPLSCTGPAILILVLISALTFDNGAQSDFKYVFFETSTISGILHASMYLDSVILPYYTGLDALVSSTFSGECASCVCRKEVLIVGGTLISYRGWSLTTFSVVGTLCSRIICRVAGAKTGRSIWISSIFESSSWILIIVDCVYLTANPPPERLELRVAAFGGIYVLICLYVIREACIHITRLHSAYKSRTAVVCNASKVEMRK